MKRNRESRGPYAGCRKGQAAAEYLVTYGWALLLLVAVIAIIISTGVFNPSYFISEECILQPDIACTGYQLYQKGGDTELVILVENRLGYAIKLGEVSVEATDLGSAGESTVKGEIQRRELQQGQNTTVAFVFRGGSQPPVGSVERMKIALTYYSCAREVNPDCSENQEYLHKVAGRITARVSSPPGS